MNGFKIFVVSILSVIAVGDLVLWIMTIKTGHRVPIEMHFYFVIILVLAVIPLYVLIQSMKHK
jgi:hypothetical protein